MFKTLARSLWPLAALGLSAFLTATPPAAGQQRPPQPAFKSEEPVASTDRVWTKAEGQDLSATIYRPASGSGPFPVLIDVHGGAWSSGDRKAGRHYDLELARRGIMVIAVDFRQAPAFQHPASSADIAAAVRWVRLNAASLNADPDRIGLIGSSSGGHLALLEAVRPNTSDHKGVAVFGPDGRLATYDHLDASVSLVIALWPVSDPAYRYRYARRAGLERLTAGTLSYFRDEAAMWDASVPRIVISGEAARLPPLLVIQPGEDSNIPQEMTFDLLKAWQARDGVVEYAFFPGQPHAFGHSPSEATARMIDVVSNFVFRTIPWSPASAGGADKVLTDAASGARPGQQ
jgi:acetyl esterase/lipase